MTLRTLNYGNYGIFLIMGHPGFCPSTEGDYKSFTSQKQSAHFLQHVAMVRTSCLWYALLLGEACLKLRAQGLQGAGLE